MMSDDDNDGQMIFGDLGGLKLPDICLTGEEKPRKNLTQETCPDRGSNPGPLCDRRACCPLPTAVDCSSLCLNNIRSAISSSSSSSTTGIRPYWPDPSSKLVIYPSSFRSPDVSFSFWFIIVYLFRDSNILHSSYMFIPILFAFLDIFIPSGHV